jgi:hypothetical protein
MEKVAAGGMTNLFKRTNVLTGLSGLLKKLGPALGPKRIQHIQPTVMAPTGFKIPSSTPLAAPIHFKRGSTTTRLGKFKLR